MNIGIMLQQLLGMLLQMVPVAVLLGAAFDEEEMRGKKRNYYIGAAALIVAVGFIFAAASMQKPEGATRFAFGNVLMTFAILLFCIFYFYFIKASLIKKIIVLVMGCNYAAIVFLMNSIFLKCIFMNEEFDHYKYPYFPENLTGLSVVTVVTYSPVFLFVKCVVKKSIQKIDRSALKRQCFFVVIGFFLFCIECTVMQFENIVYAIWIASAIVGNVIVMYYLFFNEIKLMKEQFALVERVNSFQIQSRSIGKNIEEMKRMHHNIRHHLNVISVLNEEGKSREIAEYLKGYEREYVRIENEKLSGYMILDSILRYYFQQMREAQITIETNFQIGNNYEFEPMDITILFGNCLENAIEELTRLPLRDRFLKLDVRVRGNMFTIGLENRCVGGKPVNNGEFTDWKKFLSSKRNSGTGEGLSSIDYVAKKYGGNARFKRDDGWFVMHVFLRIP